MSRDLILITRGVFVELSFSPEQSKGTIFEQVKNYLGELAYLITQNRSK
jgi:hypothetical protein